MALCNTFEGFGLRFHVAMRGATRQHGLCLAWLDISIHAPREGSDRISLVASVFAWLFLSTLPARGATLARRISARGTCAFLSTLPARGATIWARASTWSVLFLSTLPARGATKAGEGDKGQNGISIHAPREGSDPLRPVLHPAHGISIHAPREGSDDPGARPARSRRISIHAPREGSDQGMAGGATLPRNFYPRSPRGERRLDVGNGLRQGGISIHAPREGSDFCPPAPPSAW